MGNIIRAKKRNGQVKVGRSMKIETLPACLNQHLATLSNLEKRTAASSHTIGQTTQRGSSLGDSKSY